VVDRIDFPELRNCYARKAARMAYHSFEAGCSVLRDRRRTGRAGGPAGRGLLRPCSSTVRAGRIREIPYSATFIHGCTVIGSADPPDLPSLVAPTTIAAFQKDTRP